jgi:hypothetical protein
MAATVRRSNSLDIMTLLPDLTVPSRWVPPVGFRPTEQQTFCWMHNDKLRTGLDMPRKLKTQTSQGFYDLAIAAPSMKAALEAWGASSNLFHQGFATMDKPGVVMQRPVGSERFSEHSGLPTLESSEALPQDQGTS